MKVDVNSLSDDERAALLAELQAKAKSDRISRRETYEALRGACRQQSSQAFA